MTYQPDLLPSRSDPKGHIDGFLLSYNSASTVDVLAGEAKDESDTVTILSASTLTADLTVSGANGLDTGAEAADTWYSVWVIAKADGTVASLLSVSSTSPTMPATYIYKRRVGWIKNDVGAGTDILKFSMTGDKVRRVHYDTAASDVLVVTGGSDTVFTDVDMSALIPPTSTYAQLRGATDNSSVFIFRANGSTVDSAYTIGFEGTTDMTTDSAQIIEYKRVSGAGTLHLRVIGYEETV